jgi:uncharacterized protein (TIGR02246 family)
MDNDEEQIRQLVAHWLAATKTGDVETILGLMTDDVVFLMPGRAPMFKQEFAAQAHAQAGPGGPRFDGSSDIQEIAVLGEWAFMWTKLAISMVAEHGPRVARSGHTLTILRKEAGRWRIARDANMLASVAPAA